MCQIRTSRSTGIRPTRGRTGGPKKKNNLKRADGEAKYFDWVLLLLISCVCVPVCVCVAKFIEKFLSLSLFCKSVNKNNERTER